MHWNNILQLIPDDSIFGANPEISMGIFVLFVIIAGVIVIRNYFFVMKDIYGHSPYKEAKTIHIMDRILIVFFFCLPFLTAVRYVCYPYEFHYVGSSMSVGVSGSENDIGFDINRDSGYISITGYSGGEKAKIPKRILFKKVTEIKYEAFKGNENLKEVYLPDSLTTIGDSAFAECTNLEKITFSKNLDYIGEFAFANCKKLMKVSEISENAVINTGAFLNTEWLYNRLEEYIIIGKQHYIYIGNQRNVEIPEGVLTVDFYMNKKIEKVGLPDSLEEFQSYCFQGCSLLHDIELIDSSDWRAYCLGGVLSYNKGAIRGDKRACDIDTPYIPDIDFINQYRTISNEEQEQKIEEQSDTKVRNNAVIQVNEDNFAVAMDAVHAYQDFLSVPMIEWSSYNSYGSDRFSYIIADVNADGIPEMFLRTDEAVHAEGYEAIYYYDGQQVVRVGVDDAIGSYYPESGIFLTYHFGMGGAVLVYQMFDNGEAVVIGSGYGYDDSEQGSGYIWKDEDISKEEFTEHVKNVVGTQRVEIADTDWIPNTTDNRDNIEKILQLEK